jgi:hypothetical protein
VSNRWLRFVIAIVALAALGAAGYRIYQHERQLATDTRALRTGAAAGDVAIETVGEIKGALHAYVAPGQGLPFWAARAGVLLDKLRGSLLELDRAASTVGTPITETLDLSDRLAAAEQKARDHVRNGQPLLAGDVIFNDARDLLDAIRVQVARARGQLTETAETRAAATRRDEVLLAAGAVGIAALALMSLVPTAASATPQSASVTGASPSAAREPDEYARVVPTAKAAPVSGTPTTASPTSPARMPPTVPVARPASSTGHVPAKPVAKPAEAATVAVAVPNRWPDAAALCSDIARVSDSTQIGALLSRAARLLNATGIVVWMASEARDSLGPAVATGYDERLVARLGSIPRDDDNLTARAFRDVASKTSKGRQGSAAALAVPLVAPSGAVGVLSAEFRDAQDVDPQQLAIATIVAAQLSMLLANAAESRPQSEAGIQGDAVASTAADIPAPQAQGL